jgi:hypothetical protein
MANIIYKDQIAGELLIDPSGINMGIQWDENFDQGIRDKIWNKFFNQHPIGQKIDDIDLIYDDI